MKFTLGLIGQAMQLPFYLELGSGDARIDSIDCGRYPAVDAQLRVADRSAAGNLYLGTVADGPDAMRNFSAPVSVTPSLLLNVWVPLVGTVGVGFRSHAPIGGRPDTTVVLDRH